MPYKADQPIVLTYVDENGATASAQTYITTNGTYMRGIRGVMLGKAHKGDKPLMYARYSEPGSIQSGAITDPVLKERIIQYFYSYFGTRYTNCSAFAHFLFTGEFCECEEKNNLAVVHHYMQHRRNVTRIGVGDMLCVIYIKSKFARSRKTSWRNHFRKVQKSRHNKGGCLSRSLSTEQQVLSPQEILDFCKSPAMVDYHFMVCVDIKHGEPVWLSQLGRDNGTEDQAPFAISFGDEDLRPNETPVLTLIKRRR